MSNLPEWVNHPLVLAWDKYIDETKPLAQSLGGEKAFEKNPPETAAVLTVMLANDLSKIPFVSPHAIMMLDKLAIWLWENKEFLDNAAAVAAMLDRSLVEGYHPSEEMVKEFEESQEAPGNYL